MIVLKKNLIFLPFFLHLQLYLYSMGGVILVTTRDTVLHFLGKNAEFVGFSGQANLLQKEYVASKMKFGR